MKIRNSEPGATFKEFVEKWPLCIAFSINNNNNNNNNGILYSAAIRLKEDAHDAVAENNYIIIIMSI